MPIPIKNSSRSVSEIVDVFKNRIEKFRTVAQSVANSLNRNKEEVIRKLHPAPCQAETSTTAAFVMLRRLASGIQSSLYDI